MSFFWIELKYATKTIFNNLLDVKHFFYETNKNKYWGQQR
jgi:hypothetical protein